MAKKKLRAPNRPAARKNFPSVVYFEPLRLNLLRHVFNVIATHLVTATVGACIGGGNLLLQQWVRWKFSLQQLVRWKFSLQQLVHGIPSNCCKGFRKVFARFSRGFREFFASKFSINQFLRAAGAPARRPGPQRHAKIGKNHLAQSVRQICL